MSRYQNIGDGFKIRLRGTDNASEGLGEDSTGAAVAGKRPLASLYHDVRTATSDSAAAHKRAVKQRLEEIRSNLLNVEIRVADKVRDGSVDAFPSIGGGSIQFREPCPLTLKGDLAVQAKIKGHDESFIPFWRTAVMAIEFYNETHPGGPCYEAVELVSANSFYGAGFYEHINFKAKPEHASDDDHLAVRSFFAELYYGIHFDARLDPGNGGKVTACHLLEGGYTKPFCLDCRVSLGVLHPLQGFEAGICLNYKVPEHREFISKRLCELGFEEEFPASAEGFYERKPCPLKGDHAVHSKIKCQNETLRSYQRTAEMAVEFYNKNHPGDPDFEAVEVVSAYSFETRFRYEHINFKAKPKHAADDDHLAVRSFFAEMCYGEIRPDLTYNPDDEHVTCCLLEEGHTKPYCECCHVSFGVLHPLQGFQGGTLQNTPYCYPIGWFEN